MGMSTQYRIGELAKAVNVSVRTLQYYDEIGLLEPSGYTESGQRLYTEEDLLRLEFILGLKFLGFTLEEIRSLQDIHPDRLEIALGQRRRTLDEERRHLDAVIQAVDDARNAIRSGAPARAEIQETIRQLQRRVKTEWLDEYLTPEERKTMRNLTEQAYSKEAIAAMQASTDIDSAKASFEAYRHFRSELTRLVTAGVRSDSAEALNLAKELRHMNERRANGREDVSVGMRRAWDIFQELPEEKKPSFYNIPVEERMFIKEACTHYYRQQATSDSID